MTSQPVHPSAGPPAARPSRRALRIAFFALGLGLLAAVLAIAGWGSVAANLSAIGWWFPVLVVGYGGAGACAMYRSGRNEVLATKSRCSSSAMRVGNGGSISRNGPGTINSA